MNSDPRPLISLDWFDVLMLAGALLIALGLLMFHPALCLIWLGALLFTYSILRAKIWASHANKKKASADSPDAN